MATISIEVSDIPTAITGLTSNSDYQIQSVGSSAVLVATASSPPTVDGAAFILAPGKAMSVRQTATESVYVWATGRNALLVIDVRRAPQGIA